MDSKEFYASLPKKRMGAGVLFFNERDELLILKANYKEHWSMPGGIVDKDESPRQAAIREVKEELGLEISEPEFLCVDYYPDNEEKGESLQFIFHGGKLSSEQVKNFKIPNDEIDEYKFVKIEEAVNLLSRESGRRLFHCAEVLKNKTSVYLEEGENG